MPDEELPRTNRRGMPTVQIAPAVEATEVGAPEEIPPEERTPVISPLPTEPLEQIYSMRCTDPAGAVIIEERIFEPPHWDKGRVWWGGENQIATQITVPPALCVYQTWWEQVTPEDATP